MKLRSRILAATLAVMVAATAAIPVAANEIASPVTVPGLTKADRTITISDTANHHDNDVTIQTNSSKGTVTVTKVTGSGGSGQKAVGLSRTQVKGKVYAFTTIGNGSSGIFNSKTGRKVTTVSVDAYANVTINKNAFKKSKVSKLTIDVKTNNKKVTIKKNAFKGTKKKNPKITIKASKASKVTVKKGAFNGLNTKAKITVKGMSKKQFNKLKKKLRKAGFRGKIVRKK